VSLGLSALLLPGELLLRCDSSRCADMLIPAQPNVSRYHNYHGCYGGGPSTLHQRLSNLQATIDAMKDGGDVAVLQLSPSHMNLIMYVGLKFLTSGCHGGLNLAHRFRRVGAPRCGPRQRVNMTRVSGNTGRRGGYVSFGIGEWIRPEAVPGQEARGSGWTRWL
jgi:hypothetical protein